MLPPLPRPARRGHGDRPPRPPHQRLLGHRAGRDRLRPVPPAARRGPLPVAPGPASAAIAREAVARARHPPGPRGHDREYQRVMVPGSATLDSWATRTCRGPHGAPSGNDRSERPPLQRVAASTAQGQEDVAAAAGAGLGGQSFDDLAARPRDRTPSLGTATKLARGLRELRDDADAPQYLGLVSSGVTVNPTARVEYALRADDALGEPQVRQIMEYYLAVRMRRYARPVAPVPRPGLPDRPVPRQASGPWPPSSVLSTERRVSTVRPAPMLVRLMPGRP